MVPNRYPERRKIDPGRSQNGAWELLGHSLGALLGRPSTLLGALGALLVPRRVDFGGSWEAAGVIFGGFWSPWADFFETGCRLEAKTCKCLNLMTLSMNLLCFWEPEDPKMSSKSSLKRPK